MSRETLTIHREDFWATTSNKQLNFVQHIFSSLKMHGHAAVVLPDNMLFFDRKPPRPDGRPNTQRVWLYDLRTNQHFRLKTRPLQRADLDEFVRLYRAENRLTRETTFGEANRKAAGATTVSPNCWRATRRASISSGSATRACRTATTCRRPS